MQLSEECRVHLRADYRLALEVVHPEDGSTVGVEAVNISESGLCILTPFRPSMDWMHSK